MKYIKLILFLYYVEVKCEVITTGLMTSAGNEKIKKVIGPIEDNKNKDRKRAISNFAAKYGIQLKTKEEDVTNEDNIIRPCKFEDYDCIIQLLAENSCCKPIRRDRIGQVPEPLYLAQNTAFYPSTNLTLTLSKFETRGLSNSKIVEFYYNKITGKVILAFEAKNVTESAPDACFGYQRVAKETIVLCDEFNVTFKSIIITVIIPKLPKLCLNLAEVHAYLADGNPLFFIGPDAVTSENPTVIATFAALLESVPILVREYFLFKAQLWAALYIQTLCDFGLDPISL